MASQQHEITLTQSSDLSTSDDAQEWNESPRGSDRSLWGQKLKTNFNNKREKYFQLRSILDQAPIERENSDVEVLHHPIILSKADYSLHSLAWCKRCVGSCITWSHFPELCTAKLPLAGNVRRSAMLTMHQQVSRRRIRTATHSTDAYITRESISFECSSPQKLIELFWNVLWNTMEAWGSFKVARRVINMTITGTLAA